MTVNPVLVEVVRGAIVESRHRGRAAIMHADGRLLWQCGDIEELTYPRSALKAFQALPMVVSGAAEHFGFTDQQLALACASHNGEVNHCDTAASMLEKINLDSDDLECGWHWPMSEEATRALAANHQHPSALHNNCSGKHCSMLALSRHKDWPTRGYIDIEHPVQQEIRRTIEACWNTDLTDAPVALDGCSAPIWAVPLRVLAAGFARLSAPEYLPTAFQSGARTLLNACVHNPFYVAGSDRFCSGVMTELGARAFVKLGAEGVYVAAIPEHKLGIVVKIDSGDVPAVEVAIASLLEKVGMPISATRTSPEIRNRNHLLTGCYRPADTLKSLSLEQLCL